MNPTLELVFTIVGGALVLLSAYGAVKRNRRLYLRPIRLVSLRPEGPESIALPGHHRHHLWRVTFPDHRDFSEAKFGFLQIAFG